MFTMHTLEPELKSSKKKQDFLTHQRNPNTKRMETREASLPS